LIGWIEVTYRFGCCAIEGIERGNYVLKFEDEISGCLQVYWMDGQVQRVNLANNKDDNSRKISLLTHR